MGHVERMVDLLLVPTAQTSSGLISIIQQSNLVDAVQIAGLGGDVGGGEVEAMEEVGRLGPVCQLGNDLSIPRLVEPAAQYCQCLLALEKRLVETHW